MSCQLCGGSNKTPLELGELLQKRSVVCHHFCLLFSPQLPQRGSDSEGLQGFLLPDIRKEVKRCANRVCVYCRGRGAHSQCCATGCKKSFHLRCAVRNKALLSFFGSFNVHCAEHRPVQREPAQRRPGPCSACLTDAVGTTADPHGVLWTPCCGHALHRLCLQKMALSSGYFFTCPICRDKNNRSGFLRHVKKFGVYVPQRDASWETERNAFSELLEQHAGCDQLFCLCQFGRKYIVEGHSSWAQLLCGSCGSHGSHKACAGYPPRLPWYCTDCEPTFGPERPPGPQKSTLRQILMQELAPAPGRTLYDVFGDDDVTWLNLMRALEDPRELLHFCCYRGTCAVTVTTRAVADPRQLGHLIRSIWLPSKLEDLQPQVRLSKEDRSAAERLLNPLSPPVGLAETPGASLQGSRTARQRKSAVTAVERCGESMKKTRPAFASTDRRGGGGSAAETPGTESIPEKRDASRRPSRKKKSLSQRKRCRAAHKQRRANEGARKSKTDRKETAAASVSSNPAKPPIAGSNRTLSPAKQLTKIKPHILMKQCTLKELALQGGIIELDTEHTFLLKSPRKRSVGKRALSSDGPGGLKQSTLSAWVKATSTQMKTSEAEDSWIGKRDEGGRLKRDRNENKPPSSTSEVAPPAVKRLRTSHPAFSDVSLRKPLHQEPVPASPAADKALCVDGQAGGKSVAPGSWWNKTRAARRTLFTRIERM